MLLKPILLSNQLQILRQDDSAQYSDDESYAEDEFENDVDDYEETAEAELEEEAEEEPEEETEEEPALFDADSSADAFSMTAGERIGGNSPDHRRGQAIGIVR